MWYLKPRTVPAILGTLCMIKKKTDKHINKITVRTYTKYKKNALCGTAHLFGVIIFIPIDSTLCNQ